MLNKSKGNMYEWVTHTWNTVKGECYHDCSYCYMKRWGKLNPVRFDEKELKTDLGNGNFIFVGSSNDMFADNICTGWILKTLEHCEKFDNSYLFQTKNPANIPLLFMPSRSVICTTIESNRFYPQVMGKSPKPSKRLTALYNLSLKGFETYVTIEPILDFDLNVFVSMFKALNVKQVNIGADSKKGRLPEPGKEKILKLVSELGKQTNVKLKPNLNRLLN